jgi:hypothetical protein
MKGIILYQSKYGAAKQYASWLSKRLGWPYQKVGSATKEQLKGYEAIIFGGGVFAGSIEGLPSFQRLIRGQDVSRIVLFCVGASPYDEKAFQSLKARNLRGPLSSLPCFYLRGAWNQQAMTRWDRLLCSALFGWVQKQPPKEREPWMNALLEANGQTVSWASPSALAPLLNLIASLDAKDS